MDTSDVDIVFDANGHCNYCNRYFNEFVKKYPMNDANGAEYINTLVNKIKKSAKGKTYDCMIGLSGGADSSFLAKKVVEISDRATAISEAIKNLSTGEILLVAGRGHEKIQDFGKKKINFSDKIKILEAIKSKNLLLSNDFKVNIIRELSNNKKLPIHTSISQARINSQEVKKNDIFFAIKGKKIDANNFVAQAFKKKASLAIVNRIQSSLNKNKQIKIKNSLKLLTDASKIFIKNINTKIIGITGS